MLPNVLIDQLMSELSGNEVKCLLLVIRKTRGWHKEADAISVSQFADGAGIRKPRTVHAAIDGLVQRGLIVADKTRGRITVYRLGPVFDPGQASAPVPIDGTGSGGGQAVDKPVPAKGTSAHKGVSISGTPPVPISGTQPVPIMGTLQNSNLQNTNTQNAGASVSWETEFNRFYAAYPMQVDGYPLRREWSELSDALEQDTGQRLEAIVDDLLADVAERSRRDRHWLAGYVPSPLRYIRDRVWLGQIRPLVNAERQPVGDLVVPRNDHELPAWASVHGYPAPRSGEEYYQYRRRLEREVGIRRQRGGNEGALNG